MQPNEDDFEEIQIGARERRKDTREGERENELQ